MNDLKKLSPLCVDLDGTLIYNDVMWISWKNFVIKNPAKILHPFFWLIKGRAFLKHKLAKHSLIDPEKIKYNEPFLQLLKECKNAGVKIYLATAADSVFALAIANYLGIFDDVFASDGKKNLRAENKARFLVKKFGMHQFTYAGNSYDDLKVWQKSKYAIAVNLSFKAGFFLKIKKYNISFIDDVF